MDYLREIEILKRKSISHFDDHFAEYITSIFLESDFDWEKELFVGNFEYYTYWTSLEEKINELLNRLRNEKFPSETAFKLIFTEAIKVKIVVDKNLLSLKSKENLENTFLSDLDNLGHININIQSEKKEKFILRLFTSLKEEGFIEKDFPETTFKNHFNPFSEEKNSIIWLKTPTDLATLFSLLKENNMIVTKNDTSLKRLIINHFRLMDGPIKERSLLSMIVRSNKKEKIKEPLGRIISFLKSVEKS